MGATWVFCWLGVIWVSCWRTDRGWMHCCPATFRFGDRLMKAMWWADGQLHYCQVTALASSLLVDLKAMIGHSSAARRNRTWRRRAALDLNVAGLGRRCPLRRR
ncbi:hypothetical protein ACLOJK_036729 [Asimina triloba]